MDRIRALNPGRIKWCCDDAGIDVAALAAETGVAADKLQTLLDGDGSGLTFDQLSEIAAYFDRGVLFFIEQDPVEEDPVHTAAFRTLAKQKPELSVTLRALIERVEWQRTIYLALRDDVDEADSQQFAPPPQFDPADIKAAARLARQWLALDRHRTLNFDAYRSAVEAKGLLVFRSNGDNGKWRIAAENPIVGFTLYDEICPLIFIKQQEAEQMQSFTLMHELGHVLLHRVSSIDDENDLVALAGAERDANKFAGFLLLPDEYLTMIDDAKRPADVAHFDEWLAPFRRRWALSGEVILRRLMDDGRLSRHEYAAYRAWREQPGVASAAPRGTRAYRHREPTTIFGDRFVRTILDALGSQRITLAKASSYLDGLSISDVHALEKHYAGV